MHPRGSPLWGVMMGAVGLTFVTVAVFLGFVIKSGVQGEGNRPAEATDAPDAAQVEAPPLDAGALLASAKPPIVPPPSSSGSPAESEPDDAGAAEEVAAAPVAPSKKASLPPKPKPKPSPRWRPRHR